MKTALTTLLLVLWGSGTSLLAQSRAFEARIGFVGNLTENQVLAADSLLQTTGYTIDFQPAQRTLTVAHTEPFVAADLVQSLREMGMYAGLQSTNYRAVKAGQSANREPGMQAAKAAFTQDHPEAYQALLKSREERLRAAADTSEVFRKMLERRENK